jgi:hypothetical protein
VLNNLKVPSFFDHFKIRSDYTKHTLKNNNHLTPDMGGQFTPERGVSLKTEWGGDFLLNSLKFINLPFEAE